MGCFAALLIGIQWMTGWADLDLRKERKKERMEKEAPALVGCLFLLGICKQKGRGSGQRRAKARIWNINQTRAKDNHCNVISIKELKKFQNISI